MHIRQLAQLCQRAAKGGDCSGLLPTDQAALISIASLAHDHRVSPLLALALGQKAAQLAAIATLQTPLLHATRNMRIKAQLLALDHALDGSGVQMILLKGAVNLFQPIYPTIGARQMADIDLLLPKAAYGALFERLGYLPKDQDHAAPVDSNGNPALRKGGFHLAPVMRPGDLVTIEPHLLCTSPKFSHLLPRNIGTDLREVPGCPQLRQPSPVNHLIVSLIHTIKHDREALDGGLLIRGLVECELLYDRLTPDEQAAAQRHLQTVGGKSLFVAWRALADWLFANDDRALWRGIGAFLLITEFRLRARGYRAVFVISVLHRLIAPLNYRYWTGLIFVGHAQRLVQRDFWARFFDRLQQALKP